MGKKITYLLGAGASAGAVPTVNGLAQFLRHLAAPKDAPRSYLAKYSEVEDGREAHGEFPAIRQLIEKSASRDTLEQVSQKLLRDIEETARLSIEFGTPDTYAKYLSLRGLEAPLVDLSGTLDFALSLAQAHNRVDLRYYQWISALATRDSRTGKVWFPQEVKILSWNYDIQLEMAIGEILGPAAGKSLFCSQAGIPNPIPPGPGIPDFPVYHKINGSSGHLLSLQREPAAFQIISEGGGHVDAVSNLMESLLANGRSGQSRIRFAWSRPEALDLQRFGDTEILVVIGYSFPSFNRQIDGEILTSMQELERVVIQDLTPGPKASIVRELLRNTHPDQARDIAVQTELAKDSPFFIPSELFVQPKASRTHQEDQARSPQ
ncbi:MAG TPA: hypothetical protein DEA96_03720 [Leptospiraceae bacterium]|nr:hypothetical protein [Spirochaetaceae bacterium]HBS04049.1 hypothetical protein [Leptospiraceae bacterium]|tara:strand:- start:3932 stop:5065 length:1134 start_codon:yes stop_codon:yes gene_type:complete